MNVLFYTSLILLNCEMYYGFPECCVDYTHNADYSTAYKCKIICKPKKEVSEFCLSCPNSINDQPVSHSFSIFSKPFVVCKDFMIQNKTTVGRVVLQWSFLKIVDNLVFLVEGRHSSSYSGWYFVGMTDKTVATISNLKVSEHYQFQVTPVMSSGLILSPIFSVWTSVSGIETYMSPPTNLTVTRFQMHKNLAEAVVTWNSSKEIPCSYKVYCLPAFGSSLFQQKTIILPKGNLSAIFSGLEFETNYTVSVSPFETSGLRKGHSAEMWFVTPSCLSLTGGNFSLCAPGPPLNVSVHWFPDLFEAILTWLPPNHTTSENNILYYVVSVVEALYEFQLILQPRDNIRLEKNSLTTKLSNLQPSKFYVFEITAISKGGIGLAATIPLNTRELRILSRATDYIPWHYLIPSVAGALVVILIAVICHTVKMQRKFKNKGRPSGSADVSDLIRPFMIQANKIEVLNVIGEGAFAAVHRGIYFRKKNKETVAVKIFPSETISRHKLLHEVTILKSIGRHNHIVGLIGFTLDVDKTYLLLEYCKYGDLHSWLVKLKKELINIMKKTSSITPSRRNECHSIKLCSYIYQVAVGMEFIACAKVIHRDIATRNILLCNEMHVKIGDFGLAKDVSETSTYTTITQKKLPIRWMAPEAIEKQTFSFHTDVWSFGVFMWEVFKFGKLPYAGLDNSDILLYLKSGKRLPKPRSTTEELYAIMCKCWLFEPTRRPTFKELKKMLENIMTKLCNYTVIVDK